MKTLKEQIQNRLNELNVPNPNGLEPLFEHFGFWEGKVAFVKIDKGDNYCIILAIKNLKNENLH